jgi:hypothetical protein
MRGIRVWVAGLVTALVVGAPALSAQATPARPRAFTQRHEWRGERGNRALDERGARLDRGARWMKYRGALLQPSRWKTRHYAFHHRHHRFQHHHHWREHQYPRARFPHRGEI